MTEILRKLQDYGANIDTAINRFMGDEELYISCLHSFADDPGFSKLGEALESKDLTHAFEYAHALKGVAANLSLTPLLNRICDIVEPLREKKGSDWNSLYQNILQELHKIREILI